jgi:microcystin degradation protein MlrC
LDPHCHLTDAMVSSADLLISCKHFPHDDYGDRAAELFELCVKSARGEITPKPAVFDCRMIGIYPTTEGPMQQLVELLFKAEDIPKMLSVSFIHGFPYGDTQDTGAKVLAYSDFDGEVARACAERIGREIYSKRAQITPRYPSMTEALEVAAACKGLVVLADMADNPGGGAPGDNVGILAEMTRRETRDAAFGAVWDPQVALMCAEAGVGSTLALRIGGKTSVWSGAPLDADATIRAIAREHSQMGLGDTRQSLGLSVWIEVSGVDVVVTSVRSQVYSPDLFTGLGLDLVPKRLVVVKSVNHFYSRFAPIAAKVIHVATPGALSFDFATLPYRKRSLCYYPRVEDPLPVLSRESGP